MIKQARKPGIIKYPMYKGFNAIICNFKPSTRGIMKVVVLNDQMSLTNIRKIVKSDSDPIIFDNIDCINHTYEILMHDKSQEKRGDIIDNINIKNAKVKDMIK